MDNPLRPGELVVVDNIRFGVVHSHINQWPQWSLEETKSRWMIKVWDITRAMDGGEGYLLLALLDKDVWRQDDS